MANTTIKFKRLLDVSQQLTSGSPLTAGEPLWFGSSWYTNNTPKLLVGNTSGTPTFVGPYYGGTGISVTNSTSSVQLGEIKLNAYLSDLQDVTITSAQEGQILYYSNSGWVNHNLPTIPTTLGSLTDVTLSNIDDEQVLWYDSTSQQWVNHDLPNFTYASLKHPSSTSTFPEEYGFAISGYPAYITTANDHIDPSLFDAYLPFNGNFFYNTYTRSGNQTSVVALGYDPYSGSTNSNPFYIWYCRGNTTNASVHALGIINNVNSVGAVTFKRLGQYQQGSLSTATGHYLPEAAGLVLQHTMLTPSPMDYSLPATVNTKTVHAPVVYSTHINAGDLGGNDPKKLAVPIGNTTIASAIKTKSSLISDESAGEVGVNNLHFKYADSEIADDVLANQERGYYVFSLMSTEEVVSAYNGCNSTYSVLDFGNTTNTQLSGITLQDVTINLPFEANTDPTCECTHYLLIKNGTEVDLPISLSFSSTLKNTHTIIGNLSHKVAADDNLEIRIKITTTGEVVVTTALDNIAYVGEDEGQAGGITSVPVNDATITLQVNGSNVDSFTTNASSNKSINIAVNELPSVTSSDNGKALIVSSGAWTATSVTTIYTGTSTPSSGTGSNGDIYIQTVS